MSKPTLRVKNTCRQCGSTWSPRGTSTSNMCPECGSQDIEVTTRPAPRKKTGGPVWLLVLGAVLLGGGGLAALFYYNREPARESNGDPKGQPPAAAESPFKPGDAARVKSRTRNVVLADEDVADELAQLRAANNQAGIIQLMRLHPLKLVEIPNGTSATVLGISPHGVRVEIAEGGYRGRKGILPADVLEPTN